jgi:serine/threonine protein phosphatase PrpC
MAVNLISHQVAESDPSQPLSILQATITAASQAILERAQGDDGQKGMGATCVCAWVIGSRLYTASVGDSRLYLLSGHAIHQISTDHTWVQEALERCIITAEQAHGHRNSHVIRRYLGSPNPPQVDFRLRLIDHETDESALSNQGLLLLPGDMVVLCSDGIVEAMDVNRRLFSFSRLQHSLAGLCQHGAAEISAGLIQAARAFASKRSASTRVTRISTRKSKAFGSRVGVGAGVGVGPGDGVASGFSRRSGGGAISG